ncbi:Type II restriction/modification system, DNA methylase subunit YeeA [Dethiosulfatibacter aminovorans DSM 17477]|uniref:site-specific DNA-methyltransferase (adenine-specific) n=1 Tax=Dethiosulfatibacter aminovorans DSM 17477 TaxID=1121476 RepID=A0A1M6LD31_9FIRM|nr:BREX-1 system adenine-specific DNA-methyltransferase PglX [Dethiosulfatibacter aminovorans]SHJ69109.1 Type II restriction/modification system, DNA methylase subunit YeeA [Dethiosulfatibacter aminovorans DSM 17477]
MNKTAIKNFAIWARRKLISDITYKAGLLGISDKGISEPLPISTDNIQFFDIGTGKPTEIANEEIKQRKALVARIREKESTSDYETAYQYVVEEVAYTWFNRLIAVRFMEVNDYLPSRVRVLSSEAQGKSEPDIVTTPFDTDMEFTAYEQDRIIQLKDENKLDELFRMLFIKQCNKLNEVLPGLFEKTSDYTEPLLSISFTDQEGIVNHLINDIAEEDFTEAVEIIGWLYQYYNTEPKDEVFALLKKKVKITKERIPAATQLFTPDWIVRYMVENSIGRLWVEGHPDKDLKSEWKYYLEETEQKEEVIVELGKIREDYKNLDIKDIKIIDPAMGSGHILVYAFEVLMQIYESQGYTQRDAATTIIENNLYGLDIDDRAYQLAYFAVMMKARKYDRRFLTREIVPQLYSPKSYKKGQELGSLINVDTLEQKPQEPKELTIFNLNWEKDINTWNFRRLLSQKYDVVITNPPYMGGRGMNAKLSDCVKKNYNDSKSDLFAVFIEKCLQMAKENAYTAMITQHAFMFLSSYEKLRGKLLYTDIINMAHLGARAFEEIGGEVVQTTSFVMRKSNIKNYKAIFTRLVDYNSQQEKEKAFLAKNDLYIAKKENFSKIPGSPIAYWVSEKMLMAFDIGETIGKCTEFDTKLGMSTNDNGRFLRKWYEIEIINFVKNRSNNDPSSYKEKWFPYSKGGGFRKWFGNVLEVINWENNGYEVKELASKLYGSYSRTCKNSQHFFREAITWNLIASGTSGFRYLPAGCVLGDAGPVCFSTQNTLYLLAFLNCNISKKILPIINPTINCSTGVINQLPIVIDNNKKSQVEILTTQNISHSKTDWDSFETSWDFKVHPLVEVREGNNLQSAFENWALECDERFNQLKANEKELNRIFIDIYGLQDELTTEVEENDVTVRRADLKREIKSLISYAVGCMFGRYSLDKDGLVYAGGQWNLSEYSSFIPDNDNCIPITDEEYFEDDIVGRFVEFVKAVYGKETLEENLDFITKALGGKGDTSREVIRNYFIKDFFKDHVKTYQKRPIYWLYDSGKQNGFKALIYLHRYTADTSGVVRVDYLHRIQKIYTSEIERMQDMIDNSSNAREVAQAEKRKEKLIKQLKETKEYDEKIAHIALSRIAIDLDDGVKVNYEKIQTGQDDKKLEILAKI